MSEMVLGQENITRLFFRYTVPTVVGMAVLGLNVIVDGFFVGRYLGAEALACVNLIVPFSSLLLAVSIVVGIGMLTVIGRLLGAGEKAAAQDALRTALVLVTAFSLLLTAAALGWSEKIALLLGARGGLEVSVAAYLQTIGFFVPCVGLVLVFDYVLKIIGKPGYAMAALAVAVASHMALNYLFIVSFGWGIVGAAKAHGLSFLIGLIVAVLPFLGGETALRLVDGEFYWATAKEIIYNGSSEGLGEAGAGITAFLFNLVLLREVGPNGVAAFTAISYLAMVSTNMLLGIADGISSIISYNYGLGRLDRVTQTLRLAGVTVLLVGVMMFAGVQLAGRELIGIFLATGESELWNFAVGGAKLYAFAFLLNGLNILASGYFTAIGSPKEAALIAVSRGAVWVGLALIFLAVIFGVNAIWLAVPLAEAMTLLLSGVLLYRQWTRGELVAA